MKTILKKMRKTSERGQAIILVAFAIIGMVAMVGLMIDGGILLIEYARLKRGIDSASVAAASQFRKGFVGADMIKAGREFLKFNQSDATVNIYTCDYPNTNWDSTLCSAAGMPKRKLVRVTAKRHVDFGFMRVVGINGTDIEATSVGEAASIDMVLFIDTSSSMAYETTTTAEDPAADPLRTDGAKPGVHAGDDPDACNNDLGRRCEPLGKVKVAALNFIKQLFYPYDRVALVASTQQRQNGTATRKPELMLTFSDTEVTVENAVKSLKVFRPKNCPDPIAMTDLGPCLKHDPIDAHYSGQTCGALTNGGVNPTSCGASNIGGGLYLAGDQFGNGARTDSFWVVIALIGGPANAAVSRSATDAQADTGFCPGSAGNPTWSWAGSSTGFCRDRDPMPYTLATNPRRKVDLTNPLVPVYPTLYDADDYARDAADYIAAPSPKGQSATLFSICLGAYCQAYPSPDPFSAEHLGQYMALSAGNQYDALGVITVSANHGLYFCADCGVGGSSSLAGVFTKIAENIFTRISQ